jgi:hypothetical protein
MMMCEGEDCVRTCVMCEDVCEGEDLDPSRVAHISWWQAVRVLSRPLGQKTSSQSHHQQGFGIARKGLQILL